MVKTDMATFSASVDKVSPVTEFVMANLNCLTNTRLMHWDADTYAVHVTLGEFYDELADLLDEFTEQYQGKYGKLMGRDKAAPFMVVGAPPVAYLSEMRRFIENIRHIGEFPSDSELQNKIDEILGEYNQTLNKLRFYK